MAQVPGLYAASRDTCVFNMSKNGLNSKVVNDQHMKVIILVFDTRELISPL